MCIRRWNDTTVGTLKLQTNGKPPTRDIILSQKYRSMAHTTNHIVEQFIESVSRCTTVVVKLALWSSVGASTNALSSFASEVVLEGADGAAVVPSATGSAEFVSTGGAAVVSSVTGGATSLATGGATVEGVEGAVLGLPFLWVWGAIPQSTLLQSAAFHCQGSPVNNERKLVSILNATDISKFWADGRRSCCPKALSMYSNQCISDIDLLGRGGEGAQTDLDDL